MALLTSPSTHRRAQLAKIGSASSQHPFGETTRSPPPAEGPDTGNPGALFRRSCPTRTLPPRDRPIRHSTRLLNPLGTTSARASLSGSSRLWPRFTWNVQRESPTVICGSPIFPKRTHWYELRFVEMLTSAWIARVSGESPVMALSCNSQPGPATSPLLTRSERPASEPPSPHIPTDSRTYSPAGPVFKQQGVHSPSWPHGRRPFRCLHRPENRCQPELCSHGPRDQQDPNQTQPPGWSQIRRLEAQTHPHLPNLTCLRRRASRPKDFTRTAA